VAANDEAPAFERAGVALSVDVPGTPVWVSGDWTRLTQVAGNLLQNAARFTPRGGRVTASVRAADGSATLEVRDTGAGIPAELLPRLFTPFTQAEQGLARTQGGLGLGLALVRGLAELHGGTATAASEGIDRGATFTVRLPRHRNRPHTPAARRRPRPSGGAPCGC
jgi:signal transduction histidine kinase